MLSFAKQRTLHSPIVENAFHFAKLSCKLGLSIFRNDLIRFLWQVGLSTLTNAQKTWEFRHSECHLHVYIGISVCIQQTSRTVKKLLNQTHEKRYSREFKQIHSKTH